MRWIPMRSTRIVVLMDDLAVVRDGIAVLTRPGEPSRRGEVSFDLD